MYEIVKKAEIEKRVFENFREKCMAVIHIKILSKNSALIHACRVIGNFRLKLDIIKKEINFQRNFRSFFTQLSLAYQNLLFAIIFEFDSMKV